jgi:hypothetical protein
MLRMRWRILPKMMRMTQWESQGVLAGDGDDAAYRDVAGGGKVKTSPETVTTRLAVALSAEARIGT